MASNHAPQITNGEQRFPFRRHGRVVALTYPHAFAVAHYLWSLRRYEDASTVFENLSKVGDRGPRAAIFLAHCRAMLGDYGECSGLLHRSLSAEEFGNAAQLLHDAFVMWKCGFFPEAKAGLKAVLADQQDLPSIPLILADLLAKLGNHEQPPKMLDLAIRRDRPNGAIARIARKQLPEATQRAAASRRKILRRSAPAPRRERGMVSAPQA